MKTMTVNFEAYVNKSAVPVVWYAIGCSFFMSLCILFAVVSVISAHNSDLPVDGSGIIFNLVIGLIIVGGITYSLYLQERRDTARRALTNFIIDNQWQAEISSLDYVATSLLGVSNPKVLRSYAGEYYGHEMHLVNYRYITGSGRSEKTHYFTNLCLFLNNSFPMMLLDDKQNNGLFGSDLPSRISGGKSLQLEGDFNNRFRLTIVPDSERDVLQLITPDFMQELLQSPAAADIELEANQLFIIVEGDGLSLEPLQNLFGMADIVLKNINEVSRTWQASSSALTIDAMTQTALRPRQQVWKQQQLKIGISLATVIGYAIFILVTSTH